MNSLSVFLLYLFPGTDRVFRFDQCGQEDDDQRARVQGKEESHRDSRITQIALRMKNRQLGNKQGYDIGGERQERQEREEMEERRGRTWKI